MQLIMCRLKENGKARKWCARKEAEPATSTIKKKPVVPVEYRLGDDASH